MLTFFGLVLILGWLWIIASWLDPEKRARKEASRRRTAVPMLTPSAIALFNATTAGLMAGLTAGFKAATSSRRPPPLTRVLDLPSSKPAKPAPTPGQTAGKLLFVFGTVAILALATKAAFGQQLRHYDARGSSIGTTTVISPNSTRSYDERGRSLGTSTIDSQGTTTYYDARGKVIGKTEPSR